jgi:hypothetical protein
MEEILVHYKLPPAGKRAFFISLLFPCGQVSKGMHLRCNIAVYVTSNNQKNIINPLF